MRRKGSVTLSLLLAVVVPILLFGTGSGRAEQGDNDQ